MCHKQSDIKTHTTLIIAQQQRHPYIMQYLKVAIENQILDASFLFRYTFKYSWSFVIQHFVNIYVIIAHSFFAWKHYTRVSWPRKEDKSPEKMSDAYLQIIFKRKGRSCNIAFLCKAT